VACATRGAEFATALEQLIALSHARRAAILCSEAVPRRSHRSLIADALGVRGILVVHIVTMDGDKITYTLP
jgi:uncharacterized protein (DUF488 family)